MNNNRKVGNRFEKELCEKLYLHGFWCHNLAQNKQGQPFDVIAARNGVAYPIDCKNCSNDIFELSRIEENQAHAMWLWKQMGNGECWFALKLSNGLIFMLPYTVLNAIRFRENFLTSRDIVKAGQLIGEWVKMCR